MSTTFQIVVCGSIVPDPLQTLEPVTGPAGPVAQERNDAAGGAGPLGRPCAVRSGAPGAADAGQQGLAGQPGAQGQAAAGDDDGGAEGALRAGGAGWPGFAASPIPSRRRPRWRRPSRPSPGWTASRLLLFGGWESASRGAGSTLQMVGERLGITEQFQGVDQIDRRAKTAVFEMLERVEGGRHQVSVCAAPPAVLGWATGNLPEPRNNPQVGMANMRAIMPALQRAKAAPSPDAGLRFASVSLPKQQRETRIVKDMPAEEIAREIVAWMRGGITWKPFCFWRIRNPTARWPSRRWKRSDGRARAGRRTDRRAGGRARGSRRQPDRRLRARRDSWRSPARRSPSRATRPTPPPPKRSAARPAPPS